jgi:hypothetical protein
MATDSGKQSGDGARAADVDLASELVQFRDYYQARGDSRADWDAAFRVRVRRSRKGNGAGHRAKTAEEIREEQEAFQAFEASMTPDDVEYALADAKRIGFRPQRRDESQARYVFEINDAAHALDVVAFQNLGIDRTPSFKPLEEAIPNRKLRAKLVEKRTTELRSLQGRLSHD